MQPLPPTTEIEIEPEPGAEPQPSAEPGPEPAAAPATYRPAEFWDDRLRQHFDMVGVGYRRLGKPFNLALYRQRLVVLRRALGQFHIEPAGADLVELGPGTGFYIDYWQTRGLRSLLGLDIAAVAAERLAAQYPNYAFAQADITQSWPAPDASADIVTAFDVLFHITDDERFGAAIAEAGRVTRPGGVLLISDLFIHGQPFRTFHQASRSLDQYVEALDQAGFAVLGRLPIFFTMHPALDLPPGRRSRLAARWWTWLEERLSAEPRRGYRLGRVLGWVDRALTKVTRGGPSTELLVARRRPVRPPATSGDGPAG
jgi:SAM-dependent methyltransferase